MDPDRPMPSQRQVKDLERFIPVKNMHLAILRSSVNFYPANHADIDVKLARASKSEFSLILSSVYFLLLWLAMKTNIRELFACRYLKRA